MGIFQDIQQSLSTGDKEVRSWFLIKQSCLPFVLCGSYALFSWVIGPALMKNRKPFVLRKPMIVFNFLIVAAYVISLATTFWNFPKISRQAFCKGVPVKKGDIVYTMVRAAWVVYILKYIEFGDTLFFILRKKNQSVTFLHVIHHTIVPILGWTIFRTESSGFQSIPVLLNSFVHVVMYTYYGLAAMGPQMRRYLWWKKYLTQLQIVQFVLILLFVTVIVPLTGCEMRRTSYLIDLIFGLFFLVLFYKFYKSTFISRNATEVVKNK